MDEEESDSVRIRECRANGQRHSESCYFPCRYTLDAVSCVGFAVVHLLRVNLSVALVAMVNSTYANSNSDSHNNPECQQKIRKASSNEVSSSSAEQFRGILFFSPAPVSILLS